MSSGSASDVVCRVRGRDVALTSRSRPVPSFDSSRSSPGMRPAKPAVVSTSTEPSPSKSAIVTLVATRIHDGT